MPEQRSEEPEQQQHEAREHARFAMLRGNPAFARLWLGESVAEAGAQITTIAMPLLVLSTTHSAADAGFVGVARSLATAACVLPAGVLADRFDRRVLMLACAAVRGLAIASVPLALALGRPPFVQLALVALLDAGLSSIAYIAERSLLPEVVPAEHLSEAVTANEARTAGATLAGPPAGGALFGLARAAPFLADLASALVSLASLSTLPVPRRERRRESWRQASSEIHEGLAWLMGQPLLRAGGLLYAAENITIYGIQLLGLLILHRHGVSSAGIGAAYAIIGAAGLLSAAFANPLRRRLSARPAILIEPWSWVVLVPLLLVLHSVVGVGLTIGAMMLPMTLSTSIVVGRRLTLTPEHLRGRVQASGSFVAVSLAWVGPLAVGLIVQYVGESAAVLAVAAWALTTALLATAARGFRELSETAS